MRHDDYQKIITIDPEVKNGEPCIRGLPITVMEIVSRFAVGQTIQKILADYPQLTKEDIKASLAFAAEQKLGPYLY